VSEQTDSIANNLENSFGEFSVPDKPELGWVPAEHVFVDVSAVEVVIGAFVSGEPDLADAASVIEFDLEDIQITDLIADFSTVTIPEIDINDALEALAISLVTEPTVTGTAPNGNPMLSSVDEAVNNPLGANSSTQLLQQADFGLGDLTVIIDDGADSVAI